MAQEQNISPPAASPENGGPCAGPLSNVSQTLFNPVYARALESERKDGIIVDAYARRIVREAGYDCGKFATRKYNHVGSAVRTRLLDRIVARFLGENPAGTVVILGCGMDARPYRADNGLATWVSLDLPEVIALRERFFAADARRLHLGLSALDTAWFNAVPEGRPVLVIMEGLAMYLPEEGVRDLVAAMAERFPGGRLALESMSRGIVAKSQKTDMTGCGVSFTWGMDCGKELEAWSPRVALDDEFPFVFEERFRWGFWGLLPLLASARKAAKISLFRFSGA